jgi:hypothetical protein
MALFVQVFVQQASAEYYPAMSPVPPPEGYPVPAPATTPPGESIESHLKLAFYM